MKTSRFVFNKSRIILIFILVFGTVAEVGAYSYVETYMPTYSSPVTLFLLEDLSVDPYEARLNQLVNISANVTNLDNFESGYSLNLNINDTVVETKELKFLANESQLVTFSVSENVEGSYNVTIGDLVGMFSVTLKPTPPPETLEVSNIQLTPRESWPGQIVNVSVDVANTGIEEIIYRLPIFVDNKVVERANLELAAGAVETITVGMTGIGIGEHRATVSGKSASFRVVETGKHTLHVISARYGFTFTLDGETLFTRWSGLVDAGPHTVTFPALEEIDIGGWGIVPFTFTGWSDGSQKLSKTVDVQSETYVVTNYVRPGSCPSLYIWNGTSYAYTAEVSDGAGWLGYLDHFKADGSMVFSYNYPWDYIKLDPTQLQSVNGYYKAKIAQLNDEIFYLDSAKIVAIDHPTNVDVFSTTSTFIYDLAGQGTMYTVSKNPPAPLSAVNGTGQNVLPLISKLDENVTSGTRWAWTSLTLNLGDLAGAEEIKLVVAATTHWPTTAAGGTNFLRYANQPGVTPSPPPFMEVKAQNGSWIRVPENRQFPFPDVTNNVFVVNLTGLFPTSNYELRINTYQDIRFDYIGVDTTSQQNIIMKTISPTYANLQQGFTSPSNSSGSFTRYGNVLALLQSADDIFVIGRQGDEINLQFPVDTSPVPLGMERDYFVIASCWFKGKGLPYVPFMVDPLPFHAMTSFPYSTTESYPYDRSHKAYLLLYNTRIISPP